MKKLEIEIPYDKEIDWEASARQKQIVLKDKQLTYKDICDKLFEEGHYYIDSTGDIRFFQLPNDCPGNAITKHQLECIIAKNKLANVAVYLNDGWKPDLNKDFGYCILLDWNDSFTIERCGVLCIYSLGRVVFKSKEMAQQAIEILGEETIKASLTPLY